MTARTTDAVPDHPDAVADRLANAARLRAAAASHALTDCGARFIGGFEGVRLAPYNDPVGYCTVGIGHLLHYSRCTGSEGALPDEVAAWTLLRADVAKDYAPALDYVTVALGLWQADALVSFIFNVGTSAFQSSTLLRRLNAGDAAAVPAELMRWNKGGGVELPGLTTRRRAEGLLFAAGNYGFRCDAAPPPRPRSVRREDGDE